MEIIRGVLTEFDERSRAIFAAFAASTRLGFFGVAVGSALKTQIDEKIQAMKTKMKPMPDFFESAPLDAEIRLRDIRAHSSLRARNDR